MSAQAQAEAVLLVLNAALAPKAAYDLDKVPLQRPEEYVEVTISRRFGGNLKQGGSLGVVGYRVTVRAVSAVSIANVRKNLEKCRAALEFSRLAIGSRHTTPVQFETEDPANSDDGWFSGMTVFTYAL